MKFLVVVAVVVAYVSAAAIDEHTAPIVKSSYDSSPEGNFQYAYETGNGIYVQAEGVVKNPNAEVPAVAIQGAYKYTSPEGVQIDLSYVADEEGYKPVGSHLPVPPEIPELIVRSLQYIAAHPPPVEKPTSFQG